MDLKKKKSQNSQDYQDFFSGDSVAPSATLTQLVMKQMECEVVALSPMLYAKAFFTYFLTGAVSLTLCPQFGIGPLGGGHGILHAVMQYGPLACGLFCGTVFLGTGSVLSQFLMSRGEVRALLRRRLRVFPFFAAWALAVLMMLGTMHTSLEAVIAWQENEMAFLLGWFLAASVVSLGVSRVTDTVRTSFSFR